MRAHSPEVRCALTENIVRVRISSPGLRSVRVRARTWARCTCAKTHARARVAWLNRVYHWITRFIMGFSCVKCFLKSILFSVNGSDSTPPSSDAESVLTSKCGCRSCTHPPRFCGKMQSFLLQAKDANWEGKTQIEEQQLYNTTNHTIM